MKDDNIIRLVVGILLTQVTVKILKRLIMEPRPQGGGTYGMPSSRAGVITFIIIYLIMNNNLKQRTILIITIVGLLSVNTKLILKEHSLPQILVGSVIGFIISIFVTNV